MIDSIQYFNLVEEQLAIGQRVRLIVGGESMLPTLSGSDTIEIEPLCEEPHVGEVLMFSTGNQHIFHRLTGREGDLYILQGDNCLNTERVSRKQLQAKLVRVIRADGSVIDTDSETWRRISRHALRRQRARSFAYRWLGRQGRRQLRPWYFVALAILMWAPLNGLGVPLDNYLLGLRLDHLLHASVFLPCALFLWDIYEPNGGHKWATWATSVAVGLLTETVQWILPYRGFDINDLVANILGVTLGWLIIAALKRRQM